MLRFLRGQFGRYEDRAQGYSVRLMYRGYPGMNARYVEGGRTLNVFGEVMANGKDWCLDSRGIPERWEAPHDAELLDDGQRTVVLDRIVTALGYMSHRVWLWDRGSKTWKVYKPNPRDSFKKS